MPLFIASLLGGLINIAGTIAGRVLLSLGFGAVTYTGISTALDFAKSQALGAISGMPAEAVQLMAFLKVGECISILSSAMLARLLLNGLTNGSITRLVQR